MKRHRLHPLFVDFEPEHIGPSVMADHIEVELGFGDFASVNVGCQNALFTVLRPGHELPQWADDAASTTDQNVLGCREPFRRIAGRKIAPLEELTSR